MHLRQFVRIAWRLGVVAVAAAAALGSGWADPVTARREGSRIVFRSGTNQLGAYQAEPGVFPRPDIGDRQRRGGYLHPLYTPSGLLVTDDFPPNHVHHHGVWAAWTRTGFEGRRPDFWNLGDGTGRVEFAGMDRVREEAGAAGLLARHRYVDLVASPPQDVLEETWDVQVSERRDPRAAYQWDLTLVQTLIGNSPLELPEYHYGGLGLRGNWAWNGPDHGAYRDSNGMTNRVAINGARSRWFWMGGPVSNGVAGVVILCHPGNFRFPQPMRMHPNEPFFCYAPQQAGPMRLEPGQPWTARYRLVTMDGTPEAAELEALWEAYAAPR